MATATKKAPAKRAPARKKAEKGTLDYLELALENLNKAREHAQKDARGQIDTTVERIRETIKDVTAEIRRRAHQGD
jgi:F0F1-type ATP synthase membrane subunit b/b'